MSDIECPYCGGEQEICHDDGFGYEEGKFHEMECCDCEKKFTFETSIHFYYEARKADCLNGDADHQYKPTMTVPRKYTKMVCAVCDDSRPCTPEELAEICK